MSPPDGGFGHVVEYPKAIITKLSKDHGQLDVSTCDTEPKVVGRVTVIRNHIRPCVDLRDTVWWLEPKEPPRRLAVDARGRIQ
jgi:D-serine deaminase-like pyridoxal phosphate-dependent protein